MKILVFVILVALCTSTAFAEQSPNPTPTQSTGKTNNQIHRSNLKIAVGLGLMGAGLITGAAKKDGRSDHSAEEVAIGTLAAGMGLITWGVWERWQAVRPQTTLGVMVGDRRGVQILHRW